MDYAKHYDRLIDRARNRKLSDYSEAHHVVPKCLGGSDHPNNIVRLTGAEHYVAHLLLVKMHPSNSGLAWAAHMMTMASPEHGGNRSKNKLYDWLRRRISSEAKKRIGEKNGSFGTMWITDGTSNKKIGRMDLIPDGWFAGRVCMSLRGRPSSSMKPKKCRVCSAIIANKTRGNARNYCVGCAPKNANSKWTDDQVYDHLVLNDFNFSLTAKSLGWKRSDGNNKNRLQRVMRDRLAGANVAFTQRSKQSSIL